MKINFGFVFLFILLGTMMNLAGGVDGVYASSGVDTKSNVSTRSLSDASTCKNCYRTTGFGGTSDASYKHYVTTGEDCHMTFSHNIRSLYKNTYSFKVERELNDSSELGFTGSEFTIKGESGERSNGGTGGTFTKSAVTNDSSEVEGDYYIANGPYNDGASPDSGCKTCRNYVLRDFYTINFSVEGEYTFCEIITITEGLAKGTTTKSCVTFIVSDSSSSDHEHESDPVYHTLTAYAVDENGKYNTPAGYKAIASKTVEEGTSATVTSAEYDGWVFIGWRTSSETGEIVNNYSSYTKSNMTENEDVYAVYKKKISFVGQSIVKNTATGTTANTVFTKDGKATLEIENCSVVSGCKIKFTHNLKLESGSGSTSYVIARTSNYSRMVTTNSSLKTDTFSKTTPGSSETVYAGDELTLYPGMVVCETVHFYSGGGTGTDYNASAKVCASALGEVGASIDMKVKNDTLGTAESKEVYAKPGDKVTYHATYNPVLQYVYTLIPERLSINGGDALPKSGVNSQKSVGTMFGEKMSPGWNNGFAMYTESGNTGTGFIYNAGDSESRNEYEDYIIQSGDIGVNSSKLTKIAETNTNIKTKTNATTKTTPSKVKFSSKSGYNTGDVITTPISSKVYVRVPYNFINEVADLADTDLVVYAGGNKTIRFEIKTKGKTNQLTSPRDEYVAKTDYMKYRIEKCIAGRCTIDTEKENINSGWQEYSVEIPDETAGTEVCVKISVYPETSGADGNWSDKEGDHKWSTPKSQCFTVGKRPNLQVWGGEVLLNGNADLAVTGKRFDDDTHTFGSWTELGLIASGTVRGLASGAGFGEPSGWVGQYDYCDVSKLSFSNDKCNSGAIGDSGRPTFINRNNIKNKLEEDIADSDIYNQSVINERKLEKGEMELISYDGDITINGDITYNDGGYNSFDDIPKLFIYADGNINIDCSVKRIDAVLIAIGEVNTCPTDFNDTSEDGGVNSPANSNQLKINGTIIAKKLVANRTYGAAAGENSKIPAEIINYDSTLYFYGTDETDVVKASRLVMTYLHELAPRY